MAARGPAGLEDQGRSSGAGQGCKPKPKPKPKPALSCPPHKLSISKAHGAEKRSGNAVAGKMVEVAKEKLYAQIYKQKKTLNMLEDQLRQQSQVQDQLQRRLQQLQGAEVDDKEETQLQVIRRLENKIGKMHVKVHAVQKVTTWYLAVRDALKKELANYPGYLDLLHEMVRLYRGKLEDMEVINSDALQVARVTKEHLAKMEAQFLAAREFRERSLATQEVPVERPWEKRARAGKELSVDLPTLPLHDPLAEANLESKPQTECETWVMEKMDMARTMMQCSRSLDIPSRLLEQQKSSVDLESYIKECKEKKEALLEKVKELEQKRDQLKFCQPCDTESSKKLEELRLRLEREETRLEQSRGEFLSKQELLVQFEDGLDHLLARLRGVTVPGQDNSMKPKGVEEKLLQLQQKMQYLVQQVANLPPDSSNEDKEALDKVRNVPVKTIVRKAPNPKLSLEDVDSSISDPSDFSGEDEDEDADRVPTREEIKEQGLQLMKESKKSGKKK